MTGCINWADESYSASKHARAQTTSAHADGSALSLVAPRRRKKQTTSCRKGAPMHAGAGGAKQNRRRSPPLCEQSRGRRSVRVRDFGRSTQGCHFLGNGPRLHSCRNFAAPIASGTLDPCARRTQIHRLATAHRWTDRPCKHSHRALAITQRSCTFVSAGATPITSATIDSSAKLASPAPKYCRAIVSLLNCHWRRRGRSCTPGRRKHETTGRGRRTIRGAMSSSREPWTELHLDRTSHGVGQALATCRSIMQIRTPPPPPWDVSAPGHPPPPTRAGSQVCVDRFLSERPESIPSGRGTLSTPSVCDRARCHP